MSPLEEAKKQANEQLKNLGLDSSKPITKDPWFAASVVFDRLRIRGTLHDDFDYELKAYEVKPISNYLDQCKVPKEFDVLTLFEFCDLSTSMPAGTTYAIVDLIAYGSEDDNDLPHNKLFKPFFNQVVQNYYQFFEKAQYIGDPISDQLELAVQDLRQVQSQINSLPTIKNLTHYEPPVGECCERKHPGAVIVKTKKTRVKMSQ